MLSSDELGAVSEFLRTFGLPLAMLIAGAYLTIHRRRINGVERSSYLVPGWQHDNLMDQLQSMESRYLTREIEAHTDCEKRITEYKDLYKTEHGIRKDLESRFREVNARESEQTKLIEALRVEISESHKRRDQMLDDIAEMLGQPRPRRR